MNVLCFHVGTAAPSGKLSKSIRAATAAYGGAVDAVANNK